MLRHVWDCKSHCSVNELNLFLSFLFQIIQALKRLKGTSTDKRGKMSDVTKQMFDQLTEHAMKLMENGEYS